jgi:oxygen-independent coproporphyrinogen-3 oxidase
MLKKLAVYIHVPFCTTRCGYCDFCAISVGEVFREADSQNDPSKQKTPRRTVKQLQEYHKTIAREIETHSAELQASIITSIFFGGGTPSLLEPEQIQYILQAIASSATIEAGAEITLEANPDTLSYEYLKKLAHPLPHSVDIADPPEANPSEGAPKANPAVINRISMGAQSFDDTVLKTLERQHSVEHLKDAFRWAKELGFLTSLDLIYGAPGEDMSSWQNTIAEALRLEPDHISAYALTLEPKTRLSRRIASGKTQPVDEDFQAEEYSVLDKALEEAGFEWYEVSNWARKRLNGSIAENGAEKDVGEASSNHKARDLKNASAHNLTYWENGEWLGFGPSAHSHVFEARTKKARSSEKIESTQIARDTENARVEQGARSPELETRVQNTSLRESTEVRYWNTSNVAEYFKHVQNFDSPVEEREEITPEMQTLERAMLFARLNNTYEPPRVLPSTRAKLIELGFVDARTKRLTIRGRMLNDQVIEILSSEKRCPLFNTPKCRACPICIMD